MILTDQILGVETAGIVIDSADDAHQRYEPTPFYVIKELINMKLLTKDNKVIDYGSGKGRIAFALNQIIGCEVIGVEFSEKLYQMALDNLKAYGEDKGVSFVNEDAINFDPTMTGADTFYFFNPFGLPTFKQVLKKIIDTPTSKFLIFYFMDVETFQFLNLSKDLKMIKNIRCLLTPNDYLGNRMMIFEIKHNS